MKRKMICTALLTGGILHAGGYKIPEQSLDGMALGAAHIAHTTGADSAYYNPANMAFLDPKTQYFEGALTLVHLPSNDFDGVQLFPGTIVPASASSETEWAAFPTLHYVHSAQGKWRWGVSLTAPAGMTKRWQSPAQKAFAEKFYLLTAELNPSLSYRINGQLAVAAGVRIVYSEGEVDSDGAGVGLPIKREMTGDTLEAGYNLALAWHPRSDIQVAVTYRSRVDLKEQGTANLYLGKVGRQYDADVTVPIPAALNIAVAETFADRLTVELVYERTYWSAYKDLDFHYKTPIPPALVGPFDNPKPKDWKDSNTFRLGLSYRWDERLTLMAGYAYDETPIPVKTLSYELPDSDANIFSAGFRYKQNDHLEWGAAVLYDHKKKRSIDPGENVNGIVGKFSGGGAVLATVGFEYKF
ncbi:outer membrane protein transport protein [Nitratifractor sp.]|uniref:OmpP1/FadL family transporter n=1 Tax=Nitratifractor sp. TaxID=2268144 RepID=UPI0025E679F6|nr:outer membrane protein transport protein [Nitratifractor sp.]